MNRRYLVQTRSPANLRHAHAADVGDINALHRGTLLRLKAVLRLIVIGRTEHRGDVFVFTTAAQHVLHVVFLVGIETVTYASIPSQPYTRTVAAQTPREVGDDRDLSSVTRRLEEVMLGARAGRIHDAGIERRHLIRHVLGAGEELACQPYQKGVERPAFAVP